MDHSERAGITRIGPASALTSEQIASLRSRVDIGLEPERAMQEVWRLALEVAAQQCDAYAERMTALPATGLRERLKGERYEIAAMAARDLAEEFRGAAAQQ